MRRGVGALLIAVVIAISGCLIFAAPASAAGTYSVGLSILRGTHWLPFSSQPTTAGTPNVPPGLRDIRLTMKNNGANSVGVSSVDLNIAGSPVACATTMIKPGKSLTCPGQLEASAGSQLVQARVYLTDSIQVITQFELIGVTYDLQTTFTVVMPDASVVAPADSALQSLPLGYRPKLNVTITNGSDVAITGVSIPGFASTCFNHSHTIQAFIRVVCFATARAPASVHEVALRTGAKGTGALGGDVVGGNVPFSYHGAGGCSVASATVDAGATQKVSCHGLLPNTPFGAVLHSAAHTVATHTSAADGSLRFSFAIPLDTVPGEHHVSVTVGGLPVSSPDFTVAAPTGLAATGTGVGLSPAIAALLLVLGFAALAGAGALRRRDRARRLRATLR